MSRAVKNPKPSGYVLPICGQQITEIVSNRRLFAEICDQQQQAWHDSKEVDQRKRRKLGHLCTVEDNMTDLSDDIIVSHLRLLNNWM